MKKESLRPVFCYKIYSPELSKAGYTHNFLAHIPPQCVITSAVLHTKGQSRRQLLYICKHIFLQMFCPKIFFTPVHEIRLLLGWVIWKEVWIVPDDHFDHLLVGTRSALTIMKFFPSCYTFRILKCLGLCSLYSTKNRGS